MASLSQWSWVWVNSGSWWWTGWPGVLQSMGSQRVGHNWATELNIYIYISRPPPPLPFPRWGWLSLLEGFAFSMAPGDSALRWVRKEENLSFPLQTRWMVSLKRQQPTSSTFPRCSSTCGLQEQTQQSWPAFTLQLGQGQPSADTPKPKPAGTSRGLKPEATGATEPNRTECVKVLRSRLEWFSLPDANIPVNQTLNMPLITCLGNINCWGLLNRNHTQIDSPGGARTFWDMLTIFKSTIILSTFSRTELLNVNKFQTRLQTTQGIIHVQEQGNSVKTPGSSARQLCSLLTTMNTQSSPGWGDGGQDQGWGPAPLQMAEKGPGSGGWGDRTSWRAKDPSRVTTWFPVSPSHQEEQSERAEGSRPGWAS